MACNHKEHWDCNDKSGMEPSIADYLALSEKLKVADAEADRRGEHCNDLMEKLKGAVEALEFYHKSCVAKEEFCNGEFADHEVTGFQPSNKVARIAL